ncbi:hypothetical protein [Pseudomonas protegens]|uniref:hypothetical protein n=1 Tax=Pseudomonas protegens TaxID=380021 RepID=UPI0011B1F544|nr:hypothetical protein [Pseudomonas protegens]
MKGRLPGRLGYMLGCLLGNILHSGNRLVRCTTRLILAGGFLLIVFAWGGWFLSALMSIITLGLVLFALIKGSASFLSLDHEIESVTEERWRDEGWREGDSGYGYYIDGNRIDSP